MGEVRFGRLLMVEWTWKVMHGYQARLTLDAVSQCLVGRLGAWRLLPQGLAGP